MLTLTHKYYPKTLSHYFNLQWQNLENILTPMAKVGFCHGDFCPYLIFSIVKELLQTLTFKLPLAYIVSDFVIL